MAGIVVIDQNDFFVVITALENIEEDTRLFASTVDDFHTLRSRFGVLKQRACPTVATISCQLLWLNCRRWFEGGLSYTKANKMSSGVNFDDRCGSRFPACGYSHSRLHE